MRVRQTPRSCLGAGLAVLLLSAPAGLHAADNAASVPRISLAEFKQGLADKTIVALDVRSPQAFDRGHIPGALNVPGREVERRAEEFKDTRQTVVTYCA